MIRSDPEGVKAALKRRNAADRVDVVLELDSRRRELIQSVEELRAAQNRASQAIGSAKREGSGPSEAIDRMQEVSAKLKKLEQQLAEAELKLDEELAQVPNIPDPTAAEGESEEDAEVVVQCAEVPEFDFEPKDHLELGQKLGLIEIEKAARTSGSRFAYLMGDLVLVELALVQYAVNKLVEKGFTAVVPPVLVREQMMFATGFLPTDRAQIYQTKDDDLFLTGTSEVPLAALHFDEIVDGVKLPLRYCGFSTCFRREAGAAGKDTRGIFRVHQFDKVEMFSFCLPQRSSEEHELILEVQREILDELEVPYRVVNVACGDLGAPAAKKYDCEAWLPGQGRFRELTSASNTTDYQARRLRCRYRLEKGQPRPLHTLNGTAVAVGRTIIAIMENHQRADGTVSLPQALRRFGAPEVLS